MVVSLIPHNGTMSYFFESSPPLFSYLVYLLSPILFVFPGFFVYFFYFNASSRSGVGVDKQILLYHMKFFKKIIQRVVRIVRNET